MAGAKPKFRHLSRSSAHRQAMLRNMLESLIEKEQIQTTYAKAKECQRMAEKLITLGKKNTAATRIRAEQIFYRPKLLLPKLFGELRERYAKREGGYTRVLRIESPKEDQAVSAILELVDGPKDMKYHMLARTLANESVKNLPRTQLTQKNLEKVTQFRPHPSDLSYSKSTIGGLEELVERLKVEMLDEQVEVPRKKRVYPEPVLFFGKDRNAARVLEPHRKKDQGSRVEEKPRW